MRKLQIALFFILICVTCLLPKTRVFATVNTDADLITITYSCDGETKTVTIHSGETLDLWIPEGEQGVTFAYWITNPEAEVVDRNIVTNETIFYEDTTLYPVWNPPAEEVEDDDHPVLSPEDAENLYPPVEESMTYSVNFMLDDDSLYCTIEVDKNTTIEFFPSSPSKDKHFFLGWYTDKDGGVEFNQETVITSDMNVYAHWEKVPDGYYLIKFHKNYGSNNLIICEMVSKKIDYIPDVSRKGYILKGWYTAPKGGKKIKYGMKMKSHVTYYAHWEKVKVKRTAIKSISGANKQLTVRYKKLKSVDGYQIQVSTSKKFKKKVTISKTYKKNRKSTRTIKKLKNKKTYYVRVRAYKKDSTNAKIYGRWSKIRKIKL